MMLDYFDVDNLRLLYADTDSIFLSMGVEDMDDLVKPEMKEKWLTETKQQWFAMPKQDPLEDAQQKRKPGFFKNLFLNNLYFN